jgi:5-methyltetrahydrofolate--homocysteine methyltransferase
MSNLREVLGKRLLIFDGGMGTQIQEAGIPAGKYPEETNIDARDVIVGIHRNYLDAGADFITTNTFGANRLKAAGSKYSLKELIDAALENALEAKRLSGRDDVYIALDIGPVGQLLQPLGPLGFEDVYNIYTEVITLAGDRPDVILFETMTGIYELKAGILAAKDHSSLPVFTSMTFDATGRCLTGSDAEIYAEVMDSLGVDAVGINCSFGPDTLLPIVKKVLETTDLPVFVQPNAGLPRLEGEKTVYDLSPEMFTEGMKAFTGLGICAAGGCCGTTPVYISMLNRVLTKTIVPRTVKRVTRVCSPTKAVTIDEHVAIVGERLNPTGKKKLREAIQAGNYDILVSEALAQEEAGADILDVNLGVPGIDEEAAMKVVIPMLQAATSLPLQIDSSNPKAIEAACRIYNGKPLINSVNAKEASLEAVLPIVKRYGGTVIGLTLENEIPAKAEERAALAEKIINRALGIGIRPKDIVIDCLTLTASAQQAEVAETLKAVSMMRDRGFNTALGVSNVSFGLPNRPLLNKTFFAMALYCGLTLPIINPLDADMMGAVDAHRVLLNLDLTSSRYIEKHSSDVVAPPVPVGGTAFIAQPGQAAAAGTTGKVSAPAGDRDPQKSSDPAPGSLGYYILKGLAKESENATADLLKTEKPLDIINNIIVPALALVGEKYEAGRIFLPQLMQASEAAKAAFALIQKEFTVSGEKKGPVILATVEGDIHDIGKNIVKAVLESYGYDIRDLGKDVKIPYLVEQAKAIKPKAIGLSALMTTTVLNMKASIAALHEAGINVPVFVGGAVLTEQIAKDIGADYYVEDAMADVRLLEKLL